jgi:CheY-like chemotaxis protein
MDRSQLLDLLERWNKWADSTVLDLLVLGTNGADSTVVLLVKMEQMGGFTAVDLLVKMEQMGRIPQLLDLRQYRLKLNSRGLFLNPGGDVSDFTVNE